MYGSATKVGGELRSTFLIRFNPHDTPLCKIPFIDRVKVLIQTVRNMLASTLPELESERPTLAVQYMFYSDVCLLHYD